MGWIRGDDKTMAKNQTRLTVKRGKHFLNAPQSIKRFVRARIIWHFIIDSKRIGSSVMFRCKIMYDMRVVCCYLFEMVVHTHVLPAYQPTITWRAQS